MKSAERSLVLALTAALLAIAAPAIAADSRPAVAVRVTGDLPRVGSLTLAELQALGADTSSWNEHEKKHVVVGTSLEKVLRHFGWGPGPSGKQLAPEEKRPGYKQVVVARAPDGFLAVFSCAELTAEMGPTQVLVAWEVDGQPIDAEHGPLRLAVPTDREPSRSIFRLESIEVADLRKRLTRSR